MAKLAMLSEREDIFPYSDHLFKINMIKFQNFTASQFQKLGHTGYFHGDISTRLETVTLVVLELNNYIIYMYIGCTLGRGMETTLSAGLA